MTLRHSEILDLARKEGKVTVDGLADRFGVTLQTIRRDLGDLADAGRLDRVRGGAVLPSGVSNIAYEERRALNADAKDAMAAAAAAQIPEGSSLFLNIGTSTEALARALLGHSAMLVVTNNLNVATILSGNPDCDVIMTGGKLRRADNGLIGLQAAEAVSQFKLDFAAIGCSAIDGDGDMLDFDMDEVHVSRAILRHARTTMVLADSSKFSRQAPARIAALSDVDHVFTERPLPPRLATRCATGRTEVHICRANAA